MDMIKAGGSIYCMIDSSPQGGRNWILSEYTYISDEKLETAGAAAESMSILAGNITDVENFEEDMRARSKVLQDCFQQGHILPPTALGSYLF